MTQVTFNAFEMGAYLATQDPYSNTSDFEDEYDYGMAEDGWPNPAPCPIDGTPLNACKGTDPVANNP
jgi:hypothetical protein